MVATIATNPPISRQEANAFTRKKLSFSGRSAGKILPAKGRETPMPPAMRMQAIPCDLEENNGNDSTVLKYKLIALACILIAGGIGVSLPFAGNIFPALRPENDSFFLVKAFASGVILATGFIHILPDAFESLTSPCLKEHPWGDFPFTGFVAMVATILTLLIETSASAYQLKAQTVAATKLVGGEDEEKNAGNVDVHMHANNYGHVHGFMLPPINDSEVHRYRIVSQIIRPFAV
ncbi:hypothetical protein LXL04_010458 [Taraxacum kok-saghyz]